jgi:hypothetical protein
MILCTVARHTFSAIKSATTNASATTNVLLFVSFLKDEIGRVKTYIEVPPQNIIEWMFQLYRDANIVRIMGTSSKRVLV